MHPLHPYLAARLAHEHSRDLLRRAEKFRLARAVTPQRLSLRSRFARLQRPSQQPQRTIDLDALTGKLCPAPTCPTPAGPAQARP